MTTKNPPAEVRKAVRIIVRLARVADHECRKSGLSLPQYRALSFVARGTKRAAEIADSAAVSRPAVTALVGGLVDIDLLKRERVPGDRRGVHVLLTARGRKVLENAERNLAKRFMKIFGEPDHVRVLIEELTDLEEALDSDMMEGNGKGRR